MNQKVMAIQKGFEELVEKTLGKILTVFDAVLVDEKQNKAAKDLVRAEIWIQFVPKFRLLLERNVPVEEKEKTEEKEVIEEPEKKEVQEKPKRGRKKKVTS